MQVQRPATASASIVVLACSPEDEARYLEDEAHDDEDDDATACHDRCECNGGRFTGPVLGCYENLGTGSRFSESYDSYPAHRPLDLTAIPADHRESSEWQQLERLCESVSLSALSS